MKFKPTTGRMVRSGSNDGMAKNFLKNLDAGLLIDRAQRVKRKNKLPRKDAPDALLKYARPRPQATES